MPEKPNNIVLNKEKIFTEAFKRRMLDFITVNPYTGIKHLKQEQCLFALLDPDLFDILYGGAAGGAKSWTGCSWLLFMCLEYPGTTWFIGREELKRLKDSTLLTFYKVCAEYGVTSYRFNGQDNYIQFFNGSRISLLDLKFLPSDPLYERYGSVEYTGGWIEEAGEVHFGAFDTLKTRVGRNLNDKYNLGRGKILLTCNPKKNWLYNYYFKPAMDGRLQKSQVFIQALILDNPFREEAYEQNLNSITDQSKKARLRDGDWNYDDDPSVLMKYEQVSNLYKNEHVEKSNKWYLTADIARLGQDKTRIGIWCGLVLIKRVTLSKMRVDEIAKEIRKLCNEFKIPMSQCIVDADGVGGGVADILRCEEMYNASKPIDEENFDNKRSQFYFKLADIVNDAGMYLPGVSMSDQDEISQELGAIKEIDKDSDGKRKIIKREDIIDLIQRSPDWATMLMLRMKWEIKPPISKPRTKLHGHRPDQYKPYDGMLRDML